MKITRLTLLLLFSVTLSQAQTLRGLVRDADNGQAIAGATITLQREQDETALINIATDPSGAFDFRALRPGYYRCMVSADHFEHQTIAEVVVAAGKEQVLDIALVRSAAQLAEVTISSVQPGRRAPLPLGEIPLTRDQTLRFPAMYFDPARLAAAYPGVQQTDDGTNGLSIRGNSPALVGWRLEGVDIVNPNHLPNAGTFSDRPAAASGGTLMFSAQLLDNSSLLTGAFPASYGNALGGIMDMNLRRGNNRRHEFTVQAGLVGLDVAAEGPLASQKTIANGKPAASYLINYRYSTVGLLGQLGVSFGDETINFQDLSFHISYPAKKGGEWRLFGLGGLSKNTFQHKTDSSEVKAYKDFFDINFQSKTGVLGASHWSPLGRNGWLKVTVAASGQTSNRLSNSPTFTTRESRDDIEESKISVAATCSERIGQQFNLSGGISATQHVFKGNSIILGTAQEVTDHRFMVTQPWVQGAWSSQSGNTAVTFGLHSLFLPYPDYRKRSSWEPRFLVTQVLRKGQRLALSAGFYSAVAPLWLQRDQIDLMRGRHVEMRYIWDVTDRWTFRAGLFWQQRTHIGVDDGPTGFSLLNEAEYGIYDYRFTGIRQLYYNGWGKNRGVEVSMERRLTQGWFLLANATLFDAQTRGSDGIWRSARWDIGHLANLTLGKEWQREKSPGKHRTLGLNTRIVWAGSPREQDIDLQASMLAHTTVFLADRGYTRTYPDYARLDLHAYWKKNLSNRRNSTLSLDIQNLTGQVNLAYHYYDPFTQKVETKFQLGVIPNISWRLEF